MKGTDIKYTEKDHLKIAKDSEWDFLSYIIIKFEQEISEQTDLKSLKSLKKILKIYEREKNIRVFGGEEMADFLEKNYGN